MRTSLRGIAGIAAIGLLSSIGLSASAQQAAERKLLGVTIWREWRTVLQLWGPPARIEVGASTGQAGGGSGDLAGFGGGGAPAMGGGGLPGMGAMGPPGMGMGSGGRMMSGPGMMGGSMMMRGPMGGMGSAGGRMMGMMGGGEDGGGIGAPGGMGAPGMMGMGGAMGGGGQSTGSSEGEVTWVYERGASTFMFLFNKDGKVIQIQEYGYSSTGGATPTSRGVKLGDPVASVYSAYGWADTTINNGSQLTLDYSTKAHVAFQLLNQGKGMRVVGITVAQTERSSGGVQGLTFPGGMGSGAAGGGGMGAMMGMGGGARPPMGMSGMGMGSGGGKRGGGAMMMRPGGAGGRAPGN